MADFFPPIRVLHLAIGSVAAWTYLTWVLLPSLRQRLAVPGDPVSTVNRAGRYAVLIWLRNIFGICVIASAIVGALLAAIWLSSGTVERSLLANARDLFASAKNVLSYVQTFWWVGASILLIVGMAVLARQRARQGCEAFFTTRYKEAMQELEQKRQAGELDEMPPDDQMTKILDLMEELNSQIATVLEDERFAAGDKANLQKIAEQRFAELVAMYQWRDLERRIDWTHMDASSFVGESLEDATGKFLPRIKRFLVSKNSVGFLDRGTRGLVALGLLFSLLSTVGWMAHPASRMASAEQARIEQLQAAFNAIDEFAAPDNSVAELEDQALMDIDNELAKFEDEISSLQTTADETAQKLTLALKTQNYDRDAANKKWQELDAKVANQKAKGVRSAFQIDPKTPADPERVRQASERLTDLSELRQQLDKLASDPATTRKADLEAAKAQLNSAEQQLTRLQESIAQHERRFVDAQGSILNQLTAHKTDRQETRLKVESYRSTPTLQSEVDRALSAATINERRIAEQSEQLNQRFATIEQHIADTLGKTSNLQDSVKESLGKIPQRVAAPSWIERLARSRPEMAELISQVQLEHIVEAAKLNPRPLIDEDIKVRDKILDLLESAVTQPFAEMEPALQEKIIRSRSASAAEQILKLHSERYKARNAPSSYVTAEATPQALRDFFKVISERGPPESTLRAKANRLLELLVPSLSSERKAAILATRPRPYGSATLGEIGSALVRTATFDSLPELLQPAAHIANDVLKQILSDRSLDMILDETRNSLQVQNLQSGLRDANVRWKNFAAVQIDELPPTVESERIIPTTTSEEPNLVDEQKVRRAYEEYFEHLPPTERSRVQLASLDAVESFDSHFPGQNPPPPESPSFGGGGAPVKPSGSPPSKSGSASLARRLEQHSTPGHNVSPKNVRLASSSSFKMSRNFSQLRGFRRIGGVLLGRKNEGQPTFIDFAWEWNGDKDKVKLKLKSQEGTWKESPWHDPQLVELALAYAADGRPVTATMVTAQPLDELQILVHPTLVDTNVGKDAIELDRYVDTYARSQEACKKVEQRVGAAKTLFQLAWAVRALQLKEYGFGKLKMPEEARELSGILQSSFEGAEKLLTDADGLYLEAKKHLESLDGTPIKDRPRFFDPTLTRWLEKAVSSASFAEFKASITQSASSHISSAIHSAGGTDLSWLDRTPEAYADHIRLQTALKRAVDEYNNKVKSLEEFSSAIPHVFGQENQRNVIESLLQEELKSNTESKQVVSDWLKKRKTEIERMISNYEQSEKQVERYIGSVLKSTISWRVPPANFEVWSGVREKPLLGTEADFLGGSSDLPMDFMLQVAFTSPMYFQVNGELVQEADEIADGSTDTPWTFDEISNDIPKWVLESLTPDEKRVVERMSEFTRVQRLFRYMFEINHSEVFRLVDLNKELSDAVPPKSVRTARWNVRPKSLEVSLLASLSQVSLEESVATKGIAKSVSDSLLSFIEAVKQLREAETADSSPWEARWDNYVSLRTATLESARAAAEKIRSKDSLQMSDKDELLRVLDYYVFCRELRASLGVDSDEEYFLKTRAPGESYSNR